MARVFKPANFSLLPQTGLSTDLWMQGPVQSGHCFASNGDEFSGGGAPKAPDAGNPGSSVAARTFPTGGLTPAERLKSRAFLATKPIEDEAYEGIGDDELLDVANHLSRVFNRDKGNIKADQLSRLTDVVKRLSPTKCFEFFLWQEGDWRKRQFERLSDAVMPQLGSGYCMHIIPLMSWVPPGVDKGFTEVALHEILHSRDANDRIAWIDVLKCTAPTLQSSHVTSDFTEVHDKTLEALVEPLEFALNDPNVSVRDKAAGPLTAIGVKLDSQKERIQQMLVKRAAVEESDSLRSNLRQCLVDLEGEDRRKLQERALDYAKNTLDQGINDDRLAMLELYVSILTPEERVQLAGEALSWVEDYCKEVPGSRTMFVFYRILDQLQVGERFSFLFKNAGLLRHDQISQYWSWRYVGKSHSDERETAEAILIRELAHIVEIGELSDQFLPSDSHSVHDPLTLMEELSRLVESFDSEMSGRLFRFPTFELFRSPHESYRIQATKLLSQLEVNIAGVDERLARLIGTNFMDRLREETHSGVKVAILSALGEIGAREGRRDRESMAGAVIQHLHSDEVIVRKAAVAALVSIVPQLESPNLPGLRDQFVGSLRNENDPDIASMLRSALAAFRRLELEESLEVSTDPFETVEIIRAMADDQSVDAHANLNVLKGLIGTSVELDERIAEALEGYARHYNRDGQIDLLIQWCRAISSFDVARANRRARAIRKLISGTDSVFFKGALFSLIPMLSSSERLEAFVRLMIYGPHVPPRGSDDRYRDELEQLKLNPPLHESPDRYRDALGQLERNHQALVQEKIGEVIKETLRMEGLGDARSRWFAAVSAGAAEVLTPQARTLTANLLVEGVVFKVAFMSAHARSLAIILPYLDNDGRLTVLDALSRSRYIYQVALVFEVGIPLVEPDERLRLVMQFAQSNLRLGGDLAGPRMLGSIIGDMATHLNAEQAERLLHEVIEDWIEYDDGSGGDKAAVVVRFSLEGLGPNLTGRGIMKLVQRAGQVLKNNPSYDPLEDVVRALKALPQLRYYEASVIQAAVRRSGAARIADDGKGYLNRGAHKGNRPTKGGFDFRELRELQNGEPVGRVDPAATARTGNIHERVYHLEQSRPVMIVVDPRSFRENGYDALRYLIGTLVQHAISRQDPVGLIVGENDIYIKPTHDKTRLIAILKELYDYAESLDEDLENSLVDYNPDRAMSVNDARLLPLLEQRTARMNMPRGADVVLVSPFESEDLDGVERVIGRLEKQGVSLTPVKVRGRVHMDRPFVEMGGVEMRVAPNLLNHKMWNECEQAREEREKFLKRMGGYYFDLRGVESPALISREVAKDLRFGQDVSVVRDVEHYDDVVVSGEHDGSRFDAPAPTLEEMLEDDYALEHARIHGRGAIYAYMKDMLESGFGLSQEAQEYVPQYSIWLDWLRAELRRGYEVNDQLYGERDPLTRENIGVENVTYALDDWFGEQLPLVKAISFGPNATVWEQFVNCHREMEDARAKAGRTSWDASVTRFFSGLFSGGGGDVLHGPSIPMMGKREEATPDNTGADKEEKKGRGKESVWQKARKLKGRYLRSFVGVDLDSAHAAYRGHDELLPEHFAVEGTKKAVGTIPAASGVDVDNLPQPSNGTIDRVETKGKKTKVHYRLAKGVPDEAKKLMDMKLSAYKAAAAQMYGAELYASLTDSLPLEDVNAFVREEWRELIDGLDDMTVGQAMRVIQGYVIRHPKITYHQYTEDPLKEQSFKSFKERAREGGAKGKDEYVQTALMLGGGVCVELARITTSLMRLAGIPTAFSSGWMVEGGGRVAMDGHAWPEVVFPNGDGKWHAEPVETSVTHMSRAMKKFAAAALDAFKDMLAKKRDEEVEVEEQDVVPESGEEEVPAPALGDMHDRVPAPAVVRRPSAASVSDPVVASVEQEVEPERTPVEEVLHRLPRAWNSADSRKREIFAGWVGTLRGLLELAPEKWPGTETRVVDLIVKNWSNHLNMQHLPTDFGATALHDIIEQLADEADEKQQEVIDKWARVAQKIL